MSTGINGIDGLLAKMNGPPQLRRGLRKNTRPIASVLSSVDGVEAVKARVPAAILGGAILTLFSGRLRRLLEERDRNGAVVSEASYNRTETPAGTGHADSSSRSIIARALALAGQPADRRADFDGGRHGRKTVASIFTPSTSSTPSGLTSPSRARRSAKTGHPPLRATPAGERTNFDSSPRPSGQRGQSWRDAAIDFNAATPWQVLADPDQDNAGTILELQRGTIRPESTDGHSPPLLPEVGSPIDFSAGIPARNRALHSFRDVNQPTARKSEMQPHASLFVSELQEYWELSLSKEAITHNPDQANSAKSSEPTAALHRQYAENGLAARKRWPEIVGAEVARKTRAAASDHRHDRSHAQVRETMQTDATWSPLRNAGTASHAQVRQTMQADSADRVEIQNVFNIQVKTSDNGGASIEDLAEKITDVLYEQAVQHGIDVT